MGQGSKPAAWVLSPVPAGVQPGEGPALDSAPIVLVELSKFLEGIH